MIENDDTATQPQQVPDDEAVAATIQIPVAEVEVQVPPVSAPIPAATGTPDTTTSALPYMSADDLLALHIVTAPRLSPDGSQIAFAVQQSDAEQNTTSSAIWLVNARGGKGETPRQLTNLENTTHDLLP